MREGGRVPASFPRCTSFYLYHTDTYLRGFDDFHQSLCLAAAAQRHSKVAHGLAGLLVLVDWLDGKNSGFGGRNN